MPERAVIYTRISEDRDDRQLGVGRQREDMEREAGRRGAQVIEVLTDNDITGTGAKRRPAFDRLVRLIQQGEVDLVLATDLDRLQRGMKPYVQLYEACEAHGVTVAWLGGHANFATGEGILEMDLRASFAREELRKIRSRIKRTRRQEAENGRAHGGPRPFGYQRSNGSLVVDPHEAAVIRQCAGDVLAGQSLYSLVKRLNDAGDLTTLGHEWTTTTLGRMLTNAIYTGVRVHTYTVKNREVTEHHRDAWEAILAEDVHLALREALRPKRTQAPGEGFLLTGLLRCETCGRGLKHQPSGKNRKDTYVCPGWHVVVSAGPAETYMLQQVIKRAGRPSLVPAQHIEDVAAPIRDRLNALDDLFARADIDAKQYARVSRQLHEQLEAAEQEMSKVRQPLPQLADLLARYGYPVAEPVTNDTLMAAFGRVEWDVRQAGSVEHVSVRPVLTIAQQRAFVAGHVDHIDVLPVGRGQQSFSPDRLRVAWNG